MEIVLTTKSSTYQKCTSFCFRFWQQTAM